MKPGPCFGPNRKPYPRWYMLSTSLLWMGISGCSMYRGEYLYALAAFILAAGYVDLLTLNNGAPR